MEESKIIQEQESPLGKCPDCTTGSEIESVPDSMDVNGTFPPDQPDENMPIGASPSDVPISGEAVPEANEQNEVSVPAQESGEDSHSELLVEMERMGSTISKTMSGISSELHELHRLYHNEFAGRLKSMQDELDRYHEADRGNSFNGILGAIARIYVNNESLVDEISDPKTRKSVKYMLLDLSDLLEEYGVSMLKSEVGDKRNVRHCQIVERIPTGDPELHDTIAASHSTGFYKGNRTIIKELVDVYFFDKEGSVVLEAVPEADVDKEGNADAHVETK